MKDTRAREKPENPNAGKIPKWFNLVHSETSTVAPAKTNAIRKALTPAITRFLPSCFHLPGAGLNGNRVSTTQKNAIVPTAKKRGHRSPDSSVTLSNSFQKSGFLPH